MQAGREGVMTRELAFEQELNIQKSIKADCLEFAKQYGLDNMGTEWLNFNL